MNKYQSIHDSIGDIRPALINGAKAYFSIFLIDETEADFHNIEAWIKQTGNKFRFMEHIKEADFILVDKTVFLKIAETFDKHGGVKAFDPSVYKYWAEYEEAIQYNKPVYDYSDFSKVIHENLPTLDDARFQGLKNQLLTGDKDIMQRAIEDMANSNRTDPKTIEILCALADVGGKANRTGLLKNNLPYRELVAFLIKAYDYKIKD